MTAALRDPVPGWVDNVCGITGIMMEIGRGTIRSIICEEDYIVDLIPVDLVVNTLITAAWRTGTHHANNVQVTYVTKKNIFTFSFLFALSDENIRWYNTEFFIIFFNAF